MSDEKKADFKKIEQLIDLMVANDLIEVEIKDGDNKILIKRPQPVQTVLTPMPVTPPAVTEAPLGHEAVWTGDKGAKAEAAGKGLIEIKSPIVGTFYSAPSPDSAPYVEKNSSVESDTVVCIVEAMKVMNEIKAETSGTIVEILCETGQAVDYGQVLFRVRPD